MILNLKLLRKNAYNRAIDAMVECLESINTENLALEGASPEQIEAVRQEIKQTIMDDLRWRRDLHRETRYALLPKVAP